MQTTREQGVPDSDALVTSKKALDWEGARIFLAVAQHGSLRAAADSLGCALNTVRHQVTEFEEQLSVRLFTRGVYGIKLTPEGENVLVAAKRMELAFFDLLRARDSTAGAISGEVKLAVTEGLGTFWVVPRLVEFQRAYPKLLVQMHCAMSPVDILRQEADVSVQLTMPEAQDLKTVKIGRLHIMPYASKSYVEEHGRPRNLEELRNHHIVLQVSEQLNTEESFKRLFPGIVQKDIVTLRTNTSSSHYWAISKGAGIGMLPTYANAMGAAVVPVDIDLGAAGPGKLLVYSDIWLAYHPGGNQIARVRRLIEWLRDAFSPRRFPWFSDEFVHPHELPQSVNGLPLVNLFAGFSSLDYAT